MNDSVDVKRHINLRTIAKLKVHAEFDLATLSPKSAGTHQRFGCRHTTKSAVGWCRHGSYCLGGGWFNPGINQYFPDTDGRRTYNICLASANQICVFSKLF